MRFLRSHPATSERVGALLAFRTENVSSRIPQTEFKSNCINAFASYAKKKPRRSRNSKHRVSTKITLNLRKNTARAKHCGISIPRRPNIRERTNATTNIRERTHSIQNSAQTGQGPFATGMNSGCGKQTSRIPSVPHCHSCFARKNGRNSD